jgi:iduronate 2-sulfatase
MIIRNLFSKLTTLFILFTLVTQCNEPKIQPNILLIISDDLRTELNCYDRGHIISPNIDKLASEGFLFKRAYVQQSVCSASRASFLTGVRPNITGVDYPYSQYFVNKFLPEHKTISSFFFEKGYYTRNFGKIHHGGDHDKLSEPHYVARKSKSWPSAKYALAENIATEKEQGKKFCPPVEAADVHDTIYQDGKTTLAVLKAIQKADKQDEPFCFAVGYFKPHLPFNAPKKYWDLYNREDIKLAVNKELPLNAPEYATTHYSLRGYSSETSDVRRTIIDSAALTLKHGYYASVSFIDNQIGEIMKELDRLGMRENTIVVFISDHGWHLGEQGMWGKTTNFENATNAPMIVSIPKAKHKGVKSFSLVEYVDIFPTLIDAAGFNEDTPEYFEGTSLIPLINDPEREWKKAAFSQFPRGNLAEEEGYTVRTESFRYTEWWDNENDSLMSIELYDHSKDSIESVNLAYLDEYKDVIDEMSLIMKKGWRGALPKGIVTRANNDPAPRSIAYGPEGDGRRKAWSNYQESMKKQGKEPKLYIERY